MAKPKKFYSFPAQGTIKDIKYEKNRVNYLREIYPIPEDFIGKILIFVDEEGVLKKMEHEPDYQNINQLFIDVFCEFVDELDDENLTNHWIRSMINCPILGPVELSLKTSKLINTLDKILEKYGEESDSSFNEEEKEDAEEKENLPQHKKNREEKEPNTRIKARKIEDE